MIGCLQTRVRKQPIIALYFESETVLKFYNLEARLFVQVQCMLFLKKGIDISDISICIVCIECEAIV